MADFVEAAGLNQIPPGTSRVVRIADKDVALFNVDGNICHRRFVCSCWSIARSRKAERRDRDMSRARLAV